MKATDSVAGHGVLRVSLSEEVHAFKLGQFITSTYDLYFCHLWLSKVEENGSAPDPYEPEAAEDLFIRRLEIGTPNFVEFIGELQHLSPVFTYLTAFFSAGLGTTTLAASIANVRKVILESRKLEVEEELLRIDLKERALAAHKKGLITQEQLEHKYQVAATAEYMFKEVVEDTVTSPEIVTQ